MKFVTFLDKECQNFYDIVALFKYSIIYTYPAASKTSPQGRGLNPIASSNFDLLRVSHLQHWEKGDRAMHRLFLSFF